MRRTTISILALAIVGLGALPAHADYTGPRPTFRTERDYFHCPGPTPVQNVNNEAADDPAPWNTTAPDKSVQEGAGCGAVDIAVVRNTGDVDGYFKGTFTGNLRDMTVRIYSFLLTQARTTPKLTVKVAQLNIDGVDFIASPGSPVDVTPVVNNSGATEYVEFSIVGLGFANYIYDPQGNLTNVETGGLATEDGNGTAVHEIFFYLDLDPNQTNGMWVWDTTEVPSGVDFNPAAIAAAKITVTPPE